MLNPDIEPTNDNLGSEPSTVFEQAQIRAKAILQSSHGSHDWEHTQRVIRLCERLGADQPVDWDVLLAAACLHDIGRSDEGTSKGQLCHAARGAVMADPILAELGLGQAQRQNVLHCIRSHRFRNDERPRTLEAKVLFDADKLDSIGAVGVARAFLFAGEVGARLHNTDVALHETHPYTREDTGYREFMVKLRYVKDRMCTAAGKRVAEQRHAFMCTFFDTFLEEIEGKR